MENTSKDEGWHGTAAGRRRRAPQVAGVVLAVLAVLAGLIAATAPAAAASTLETVRDRGVLRCGVGERSGYAWRDTEGRMQGFRVELCRALAAAVLNDPEAVVFVPVTAAARFEHLTTGDVDVLFAGATWTMSREASLNLAFTGTLLFDGQGFLAHRSFGHGTLAEVTEGRVCVVADTTNEANLRSWMASTGIKLTPVARTTSQGAWDTFLSFGCDMLTFDRLYLMMLRNIRVPQPDETVLFPEMISREPLSPVVRRDDDQWESIVRFLVQALLVAELKGVTAEAVAAAGDSPAALADVSGPDAEARRLLAVTPGIGAPLDLDDGWPRRAIVAVGNFGELFERTLGQDSPHKLERGLNALWTDGGLHYPVTLW